MSDCKYRVAEADVPAIGNERKINSYQQRKYFSDIQRAESLVRRFHPVLDQYIKRGELRILDIGGGSGYMALEISRYCKAAGCEAECIVVDSTPYATWDELGQEVTFIEESAFNVTKVFEHQSFDLIFCNYLIHHLVFDRLEQTKHGQGVFLASLKDILRPDGSICIAENTIESYVGDWSNDLHFVFTSIRNPLLVKIFRSFGANSSGVGVYFRNKKGWRELFEACGFKVAYQEDEVSRESFRGAKRKIAKTLMLIKDHLGGVIFELKIDQ